MGAKTILLVEDNLDDEALALRAFRKGNIVNSVIVARDGFEALEQLFGSRSADNLPGSGPGLVLLDLKLPGLDGLEVLRRVRLDPRTQMLPVVIFTSSTEPRDVTAGYTLGCNSYVRKPVDFSEFVETVRLFARYWLSLNVSPDHPMGS
ncbi:MAG: response regulator [Bryobacterales bacterium]|nr:response regulator [Bryobacterales bacterium]